ncbi:hypothetical protein GCM10027167_67440 [Nocardia heshunensis]
MEIVEIHIGIAVSAWDRVEQNDAHPAAPDPHLLNFQAGQSRKPICNHDRQRTGDQRVPDARAWPPIPHPPNNTDVVITNTGPYLIAEWHILEALRLSCPPFCATRHSAMPDTAGA